MTGRKKDGMGVFLLVGREIRYRKAGFAMALICVAAAIGCLAGAVALLNAYEMRTEMILAQREGETREEMERLEDDYRRIMRDLGHNVMILYEDQSRASLRAEGYPDTYMPEDYAVRLGRGGIDTLNHLLPVLQKKVPWPEHGMEILLTGTPGQVPVYHKRRFLTEDGQAYRNPIVEAVPEDALKVGHAVAAELGLRPGDAIRLMGEDFTVLDIEPPQGDHRDIMVWCDLETVQRWLDMEGKINAIFALECICDFEALGKITEEVGAILPDVQVHEMSGLIMARGKARKRATEERERAVAAEIAHRTGMLQELYRLTAVLVPVVMIVSAVWVFFLILGNVRDRRSEIGILRAIGVGESKIMTVFLSRAIIIGLVAALIGYPAGVMTGAAWGGVSPLSGDFIRFFSPVQFAVSICIAAVLCMVAGWIPALKASQSDPAEILRDK